MQLTVRDVRRTRPAGKRYRPLERLGLRQGEPGEDHREPKEPPHPLTNKTQEATMKGTRKTTDAGLGPLIPAVLAPPEVMAQAPQGFISPPLNPPRARPPNTERAARGHRPPSPPQPRADKPVSVGAATA